MKKSEKPSTGLTKKQKSAVAKKASAGKDIGKKGKNFDKVAAAAGGGGDGGDGGGGPTPTTGDVTVGW